VVATDMAAVTDTVVVMATVATVVDGEVKC